LSNDRNLAYPRKDSAYPQGRPSHNVRWRESDEWHCCCLKSAMQRWRRLSACVKPRCGHFELNLTHQLT